MKKQMIWGSATLILLLGIATVFLLMDKDTNTEPKTTLGQQTKDLLKEGVKLPQETPQVVAEQDIDTSHPDYHVPEEGTPHTGKHTDAESVAPSALAKTLPRLSGRKLPLLVEMENPVIGSGVPLRTVDGEGIDIDWEALSPAELTAAIELVKNEEISLPEGYYYRILISGEPLLDERGFPVLHKRGEPFISVLWSMEFRPPPGVYEEYKALAKQYRLLETTVPTPFELDIVGAQMDELRELEKYQGPIPAAFQVSMSSADADDEYAQRQRSHRIIGQLKAEIFRQMGFEYLLGLY